MKKTKKITLEIGGEKLLLEAPLTAELVHTLVKSRGVHEYQLFDQRGNLVYPSDFPIKKATTLKVVASYIPKGI